MPRNIIYFTNQNQKISVTTFGEIREDLPAIIIVHGFKGFKDWGFFPTTAGYLSSLGFFVLTFNFSHNGIGDIPDQFTEEDKFAENTLSMEVDELNQITTSLKNGWFEGLKPKSIGILGHSRGGGVSIISASEIQPDCLVTWSSIAEIDRFTDKQKNEWREKGIHTVTNSRTGQVFKINLEFLEDIEQNKNSKLSIEKALNNYKNPYLIVHGSEDLTVKKREAEQIYSWSVKTQTRLEIIEQAGHTFNCVHPFQGSNPQFDRVLKLTGDFFNQHLK